MRTGSQGGQASRGHPLADGSSPACDQDEGRETVRVGAAGPREDADGAAGGGHRWAQEGGQRPLDARGVWSPTHPEGGHPCLVLSTSALTSPVPITAMPPAPAPLSPAWVRPSTDRLMPGEGSPSKDAGRGSSNHSGSGPGAGSLSALRAWGRRRSWERAERQATQRDGRPKDKLGRRPRGGQLLGNAAPR